ncbi:N(4)-(beta-N-acetylglucosaminyl)-L-asparaginase [Vicingaceae bacterium]|nr:N(4)-(beta-N-acetylglucosaminyl)-L-asparaginase [Vicingaceae bacterium]MDC1451585.1 N(4)-(beta-N-acetylglucosaminyl)-L-asparaginase [Vicingaceae bacterium]
MKRRTFLSSTALASLGVLFIRSGFASNSEKDILKQPSTPVKKPVVVSTWIHGMEANKAAWALLKAKKSALDAVEQGVRVTESDIENRSVGIGGNPDRDGNVTLDACIMNHKSECGAVAYLQNIENPISVARKVMEDTPHVMLVGKGAMEFAYEKGFTKRSLLTEEAKADWEKWRESKSLEKPEINHENHDTIGMLAIDEDGNLSGACTTSGWAYKLPGRVGDSPIIGAGLFVDNEIGAACATGMGEAVIRIAGSHTVVELMRQGKTPNEACKLAVERIIAKHKYLKGLQVGFLALNKNGEAGGYSTYAGFNYAYTDSAKAELIDAGYEMEW